MVEFEWDPKKSNENKKKHGVSFVEAREIWQGKHLTILNIAHASDGEKRSATLGMIAGNVYTAIWTLRNKSIRLISVRRARPNEKEVFKNKII